MYDELVKRLREKAGAFDYDGRPDIACDYEQAADAIEELSKPKWIKIESRPMDDEERKYYSEHYGYDLDDHEAVIYCCQLPENGQEVLVCNEYGHIWLDTFDDDPDYGVGFETNGDMDGLVAWMPLPKPYEPPKEEVVRCRECVYWRGENDICKGICIDFSADGYCSEGKRKDGGQDDV